MIRLFIAIDLSDNIKQELEYFARGLNIDQARIIQAHNLHITVKFLGYIEDDVLSDIDTRLDEVAKKVEAFNIKLDKLGAFPSKTKARVFWIGSSYNERLQILVKKLDDALKKYGFEPEKRSYKAHLTLLRFKKPADVTRQVREEIKPIEQNIDHFTLYESKLSPKGAQYKAIKQYYLKNA